MLEEAENIFGPKIEPYPYMFTGINFESDRPWTRYGCEGKEDSLQTKYIFIQLSKNAMHDSPLAIWQLAHECIHLLSPDYKHKSTILEEGMATWYQRRWVENCSDIFPQRFKTKTYGISPKYAEYLEAYGLVDQLLSVDETSVKRIREIEPRIRNLSSEIIVKAAPWINRETAKKLVKTFSAR